MMKTETSPLGVSFESSHCDNVPFHGDRTLHCYPEIRVVLWLPPVNSAPSIARIRRRRKPFDGSRDFIYDHTREKK